MAEVPTGTVTLLFSDIEGSTTLLSRLGVDYPRALTGQRQVLREMGCVEEAQEQMLELTPRALGFNNPGELMALAEDYGAALAELGDFSRAVRLLGAADAMRERLRTPRPPMQQDDIAAPIAKARAALASEEWNDAYQAGRSTPVEDALREAHTAGTST